MMEATQNVLKDLYSDSKNPAYVSRGKRLQNQVTKEKKGIDKSAIVSYLLQEPIWSLFKPRRNKFPRRKIVKIYPFETLCADLADFQKLSSFNKHFKWLCLSIDLFSNYIICRPVKRKTQNFMKAAFEDILKELRTKYKADIHNLWTDRGN